MSQQTQDSYTRKTEIYDGMVRMIKTKEYNSIVNAIKESREHMSYTSQGLTNHERVIAKLTINEVVNNLLVQFKDEKHFDRDKFRKDTSIKDAE